MFGYVVVNKPELKLKDFDRYREYYCGVCHALHDRHGALSRLSLTYDATFAAVLLTALYEPYTKKLEKKCILHPVGKKMYLVNEMIDYVADMNIVLVYYKCLDDWEDDRNIARLSYGSMIKKEVKRVKALYGEKVSYIRKRIKQLSEYEKSGSKSIDVPAGIFGEIMGEILCVAPNDLCVASGDDFQSCGGVYDSQWKDNLRTLGFYLGKFVYILDAYDDVGDDIEKGRFNPLADRFRHSVDTSCDKKTGDDFDLWVKELLMMFAAEMASCYEKLPIVQDTPILRNIIYSGIWMRFFGICERRQKDERSV